MRLRDAVVIRTDQPCELIPRATRSFSRAIGACEAKLSVLIILLGIQKKVLIVPTLESDLILLPLKSTVIVVLLLTDDDDR